MKRFYSILYSFVAIATLTITVCFANVRQGPTTDDDQTVDPTTKADVIGRLADKLKEDYVFPDVGERMAKDLSARKAKGEYDAIVSSREFAKKLTEDLQAISKDKHLRVRFSVRPLPERKGRPEPTDAQKAQYKRDLDFENHGFEKIERLRGNIGYIELMAFFDPKLGAKTVSAAMEFVANSDAIIFDLRRNGGGDPAMVALISSYLFGEKPVHLNDLYWRRGNQTKEFWTDPAAASVKLPDKPVYVLTSSRTFSGAEEFSYNLQNLKRATIVGETTGGGAHPGGSQWLSEHFQVFVPGGKAINPITKTNWEGTGVVPDIKVRKEDALLTAQLLALKELEKRTSDGDRRGLYSRLIKTISDELGAATAKK